MKSWISALVMVVAMAATSFVAGRVTAPSRGLAGQFAFRNALDFQRDNDLVLQFNNCHGEDDMRSCSAFTKSGAAVLFHCDVGGCTVDCGAVK